MSRFQAKRLLLGCTAHAAVLLAATPARRRAAAVGGVANTGPQLLAALSVATQAPRSLADLCLGLTTLSPAPAPGRSSLAVTVDDALTRNFVVTPPRGVRGIGELQASAAARFATLYGESATAWAIAADWQASTPFIACALPRELLQAVVGLARTQRWRLESLRPALVRAWNRLHREIPPDGWLLIAFGCTLTLVHTRERRLAGLRTQLFAGAPQLNELETLLAQERLRSELPDSAQLLWTGAADWLPGAATIAGMASRLVLPESARGPAAADLSGAAQLAWQLALAASGR